jgi:CheY-like chemotaxis protein
MQSIPVLLIADDNEATVLAAALAKRPELHVIEAPDGPRAIKLLETQAAAPALAIGTAAVLAKPVDALVKILDARGIPLIVVAVGLSAKVKQRALAAGVREIHDRPTDWPAYSELIETATRRLIRKPEC